MMEDSTCVILKQGLISYDDSTLTEFFILLRL